MAFVFHCYSEMAYPTCDSDEEAFMVEDHDDVEHIPEYIDADTVPSESSDKKLNAECKHELSTSEMCAQEQDIQCELLMVFRNIDRRDELGQSTNYGVHNIGCETQISFNMISSG